MQSFIRTGAKLKVFIDNGTTEYPLGIVQAVSFTVTQGQKAIFTVDSPFPAEIAQAAAPSMVRGTMTVLMPEGVTLEGAGLVPFRTSGLGSGGDLSPNPGSVENFVHSAHSKYIHVRLVDRKTNEKWVSLDYLKVSSYSISVQAKGIVRAELQFEAKFLSPGLA
jgi:hypothetical protein